MRPPRLWWIWLMLFWLWPGISQAETPEAKPVRTWWQWFDPRTSPFIPLPEIATDPNGGTTVGFLPVWLFTDPNQQIRQILAPDLTHNTTLGIGGTFRLPSYPSADSQWYVIVGAAEKIVRRVDLSYATGLTRQERWSFDGRLFFERDPTERFFGLGNRSPTRRETNYTTEQGYGEARVGWNVTPTLQLALEARPRFVRIKQGAFSALPSPARLFPKLRGLRSNHELLWRLLLTYDTRDSLAIPRRGSQVTLFGGFADQAILSSVSYSLFGIEARQNFPVHRRVTLAGHFAIRYMPVGKQAPFWALSRLGGDRNLVGVRQALRGFGEGRFIDHQLFAANVELRSRVVDLDVFTTHVVLELAPFLDVGRVFHSLAANPFRQLHVVGGLGFRGVAAPFVVGYVDVGYGSEGFAVFSGPNYPF
ncbi:MAG: BamA/TamA family outer membrane protein [Deltaproteobacteria bacterium]|nr:BamA/TamA family outer membrane protein [Deltaproteobacteria bacterium]